MAAALQDYDRVMDALEATGGAHGVSNTATAMLLLLRLFERHITDLQDGYLDADGEAWDRKRWVKLATVLGQDDIPAELAAKLKRVIDRALSDNSLPANERWKILERLVDSKHYKD